MSSCAWNYVVTAIKPTSVTHSCVGNFTGPEELNLIVAKCSHVQINLLTNEGIKMCQYGRILVFELLRPRAKTQDFLFIATEQRDLLVLEWDAETSELITRGMGVFQRFSSPPSNRTIGIIDPDSRLIVFHLYDGWFQAFPLGKEGKLQKAFSARPKEMQILDIKFLYGCRKATIAVLYKDDKDARHIKTYEVALKDKEFDEGPWIRDNLDDNGAFLLIPVPRPLCGLLIIGEETIAYCSAKAFTAIPIRPVGHLSAYGRMDAFDRYLIADRAGLLHRLVITHTKKKVTGLEIELLGETSIASTISSLHDANVFIGSSYGDSQLIKLNPQPDAKGSFVQVLDTYVNLGPITDFCVVDPDIQRQGQVVTCSGAYKDSSLRIVRNGIGINELVSVELEGIKGMWSLRSSTDNPFDTFLVVSFISETRILAINLENELEETEIDGLNSQVRTLFCHDAVYDQLVQVTPSSVRLVSSISRELRDEWNAPSGYSINVATANATQILVATGGGHLTCFEIKDGKLTKVKHAQLEYEISCLDINPIGENSNSSQLAAVGTWTDISVRIFSLPNLMLITKQQLNGDIISRSVLLCSFEESPLLNLLQISYVLCALGSGVLLTFQLDDSGKLTNRKEFTLGTQPMTLCTFSSKNGTQVFAASDRPTVIYSSHKRLFYNEVNMKNVNYVCPFNLAAFPDSHSLAIAKQEQLIIGSSDFIRKLHIQTIQLNEQAQRICHQDKSDTFAICSRKNQSSADELHFIHLLDQKFDFIANYPLNAFEYGSSMTSCSFSDDSNIYYCVGTAYDLIEENEQTKGRILVFFVEDENLQLIAEKETKGTVFSLNAFHGKLLASFNKRIDLYKWTLGKDGTCELQYECGHDCRFLARNVKTSGDFILVNCLGQTYELFIYTEGALKKEVIILHDHALSAIAILDDDLYLAAQSSFNLVICRVDDRVNDEPKIWYDEPNVLSKCHLGELVSCFHHGFLSLDSVQIPRVVFGTVNGAIGIVASLPREQFIFLEKLQSSLREVIKSVGGLSHEGWRDSFKGAGTKEPNNFLDGDLIEMFTHLSQDQMEKISESVEVTVEEISNIVDELIRLH
ncbi:hypothetical protein GQ457_01G007460 [Hibiscus cannabinus]